MSDLFGRKPGLVRTGVADAYAGEFALLGVKVPLAADDKRAGYVLDADGKAIARVSTELDATTQRKLAGLIAHGVNWFANTDQGKLS